MRFGETQQPNKSLWEVFGATARAVKTSTNGAQVPWKEDNLEQGHVLYATASPPTQTPVVVTPTREPYEPEMVEIPGGLFRMGDLQEDGYSEEKPVHTVQIESFMLGKYEITFGQFTAFTQSSGYQTKIEQGKSCYIYYHQTDGHPMVCISWHDVQAYIRWLNQKTGKIYRLPSESEWEYAARAGSKTKYHFDDNSDELCRYANVLDITAHKTYVNYGPIAECNDGYLNTAPVGMFSANAFGLHDMHGNVWEWVQDCWHSDYKDAPSDGSAWEKGNSADCDHRVVRGGDWYDTPKNVRSSGRGLNNPGNVGDDLGFRLARDL